MASGSSGALLYLSVVKWYQVYFIHAVVHLTLIILVYLHPLPGFVTGSQSNQSGGVCNADALYKPSLSIFPAISWHLA